MSPYHLRKAIDPDIRLVEQLRRDDPTGAESLMDVYGGRGYRLALRITGNASDAEEVVQDALLTVVRKIDTFRGEAAFGSWLYRIVANAAYQKAAGQRRRPEASVGEPLSVADPSRQTELRAALTAAVDALPPHYRAAVILRDVEGFSTAAVAATLGLTIANAKGRVHRARLFLRQRLVAVAGA